MVLALCSCPDNAVERVASALSQSHLISSITAMPDVRKAYLVNGQVSVKDEVLLLIQVSQEACLELFELLVEIHPDEIFQIHFLGQYDEHLVESLDSLR